MSTDGQHWYTREGRPCYEVPAKGGGVRAVNLRWDRPLGLVPSVTTVLSVWPKPQLHRWKEEQMILAALTLSRNPSESDSDYFARLRKDANQQVEDAANEGTRIHDAIECYYKGKQVPEQYVVTVKSVVRAVEDLFPGVDDWISEASFAHPDGFGGKVDLHSPSTGHVVDFKGKDGDFSDGKKLGWDQYMQLGGYSYGLKLPTNTCANVFFSRTHPGWVASHVWEESVIRKGQNKFLAALYFWKEYKEYEPSFAVPAAA